MITNTVIKNLIWHFLMNCKENIVFHSIILCALDRCYPGIFPAVREKLQQKSQSACENSNRGETLDIILYAFSQNSVKCENI